MNIKISSFFLVLVCGALPLVFSIEFESLKSHIFEPLRPTHPPKNITECDTVVTEPYGLLKKTYKRGEKEGSTCSWEIRAPANHVINVISVGYELLDRVSEEVHPDSYSGSYIKLYDGINTNHDLQGFSVIEKRGSDAAFYVSTSSKPEMLVKITYGDNVDYATQKMYIKYEFLNVDEMMRLLRAYKG